VGHIIISHQPFLVTGDLNVGIMDKNMTNDKKGAGEFSDLPRVTVINQKPDFLIAIWQTRISSK
jgi:hypothetical protein